MGARNQPTEMGLNKITGLADGTDPKDAVNKSQLDANVPTTNSITYDKIQQVTAQRILGNATGSLANISEMTASDALDLVGSTRGTLLYRGASGWSTLAPGTSGYYLQSGGAGADPSWLVPPTPPVVPWTLVKKTANQTISASTTFANDSELTFSMAANTTYSIRVHYVANCSAGGYKFACNGPASPTSVRAAYEGFAIGYVTTYASTIVGQATAQLLSLTLNMTIQNGANAGAFVMQIAQTTASGATVYEKGSYLEYAVIA